MKYIKKIKSLMAGVSLLIMASTGNAVGGIPTLDITQFAEWEAFLNGKHPLIVQQVKQFQEIQKMKQNLEGIFSEAQLYIDQVSDLHNMIPEYSEGKLIADSLVTKANALKNKIEAFKPETLYNAALPSGQKSLRVFMDASDQVYGDLAIANIAYDRAVERQGHLDVLTQGIKSANTLKKTADLNARYNAESMMLLNDITQLLALQIAVGQRNKASDLNLGASIRSQSHRGSLKELSK